MHTLIQAYDRSVQRHGTVHWSDVTPLFPSRSKEGCKAQVKTHKARLRAQASTGLGFAPPPPAALLDFDRPAARRGAVPTPGWQRKHVMDEVRWAPRQPLEAVTNRPPPPEATGAPSKPRLSAGRVAEARRALREVARVLIEDEEWHSPH